MPWDEEGAAERPVRRGWCGSPASPGSKPSRTPSTLGDGGGDGLAAESARARASGRALFQPRACAPSRWAARPTPWCDAMLEGDGGHIKELYRRGQAHEQLGNDRLGLAMKDNTRLLYMWNARTRPLHLPAPPAQLHSARAPTRLAEDVLIQCFYALSLIAHFLLPSQAAARFLLQAAARFSFPSSCTSSKHRPLRSARWRRRCWRSSWGR